MTKSKCFMSVNGKCTSDYSPLKCKGIDIPDDCTYKLAIKELESGCGKEICVKDGKSNHGSFCGCTYRGLHLCDKCKNKLIKLKERRE